MCIVAIAWQAHPRWRLVMAGNRDELHVRPAAPLARWSDAPVIAGRDLQSGGTWMGLGRDGRAAVVTNVRNGLPNPFQGPSRGALPADFLAGEAPVRAHAGTVAASASRYAPFNLVLADAGDCAFVGNHPASGVHAIAPGVHGISNGDFDAGWPKVRRLKAALVAWAEAGDTTLAPLWAALADERPAPDEALPDTGVGLELERRLSPVFIRGETYGTRASTLLLVGHDGSARIIERRFGPGGVSEGETALEA